MHIMIEVSRTGVPIGTHGRAGSIVIPHNAGLKIRKFLTVQSPLNGGAEGARVEAPEGVACGCSPPHWGEVWKGDCALSPEKFSILKLKMESFGAFWALLFTV